MRVDKPEWVSHEGQSLLSVDVHPDGSRVATAGQDGKVKLWSVAPILDPTQEADARVPRLLATLTGHTLRVLYLAMSPDGQTIVTGAGDETLRFWNVFPGPKTKGDASDTSSMLDFQGRTAIR